MTVFVVLKRHYPGFMELLNSLPDHRQRHSYQVAEIMMAGLMMFVFKRGSKNNADKLFTPGFEDNYIRFFGLRLPVMETVNMFLKALPPEETEGLKRALVKRLVEKRALDKFRFQNKLVVAVDGTGIFSFDKQPFPGCPKKTGKNGKTTWQAGVLEAKIICANGFSISIETEWYQNSDNINEKQDCEQKAFIRLARKLKKNYPRMPMILTADSLYPNNTFFTICKKNKWDFILTFKEGCLKTLWQEINLLYPLVEKDNKAERTMPLWQEKAMFIDGLEYKGHQGLSWCEYPRANNKKPISERFVHITNFHINKKNIFDISYYGRLRWKIENEGFNTQKNQGYNLQHKYAEKNHIAMQNYYQLLQIAHLINQLSEKLQKVKEGLQLAGRTLKSIWEDATSSMFKERLDIEELEGCYQNRVGCR